MSYPAFSRAERIADGTVHVLGIAGSIAAVAALFIATHGTLGPAAMAAAVVYSVSLVAMLTASGLYHLTAHTRLRPLLRRIDHAAIYLKIAGTYTPLAVVLNATVGYVVLAAVWAIALVGAARKLRARPGMLATASLPYVALGWIGVTMLIPLTKTAPTATLVLIAAGGLTYTAGVLFYNARDLRFSTAIWHGFVLAASGCFFGAVATSLRALPGLSP